jgi:hypothetical protein
MTIETVDIEKLRKIKMADEFRDPASKMLLKTCCGRSPKSGRGINIW